MRTVTVERTLKAPIERLFDLLADHANYHLLPGIKASRLLRNGKPNKNGVGAVREVQLGGAAWVREEITTYNRPVRMDYRIVESSPPMEHRGATIKLVKVAGGTQVTWVSAFRVAIPVIGGLLTALIARKVEKGFHATLSDFEKRASG